MAVHQFVWYELVTSDIDAALGFYGTVLGWQTTDHPGEGPRYAIVSAKGKGVGGVMALPAGMSNPFWMGYIATKDIDATVGQFTSAGGIVHRAPWKIPGVGRLALVADPQGAGLALIEPESGRPSEPSEAFDPHRPGHGNWNELATTDVARAFDFYAAQFGWTRGDAMDMGPMGTYQIFKVGDVQTGGMVRAPDGMRPAWLYYFGAESIPAAMLRITQAGGTILRGPTEVPGGAHIIHARDPQGAMFAMVGPG